MGSRWLGTYAPRVLLIVGLLLLALAVVIEGRVTAATTLVVLGAGLVVAAVLVDRLRGSN
jgi:hypothetical protein